MKVKNYLKGQYSRKGVEDNPKNFELLILEKLYGRRINICEWYDNLKIDYSSDGGIDFIVINMDGIVIPLIESNDIFEKMEDLIFSDLSETDLKKELSKIYDANGNVIIDDLAIILSKMLKKEYTKLTVDFIQSKSGKSFQESVLIKIKTTMEDLVLNEMYDSERYSEKLKNNIRFTKKLVETASKNNGAIEINFMYIAVDETTPKSMKNHLEIAKGIKSNMIKGFSHINVDVKLMCGNELIKFLEKSKKDDFKINVSKNDMLYENDKYCVGLVTLSAIVDFVSVNDSIDLSIFDGNVRDSYKHSSSINREIASTLESNIKTSDFWWLNNGITVICDSLSYKERKLFVSKPQIVNGLQSVVSIFDTLKSGHILNANKKILVRFLVEKNEDNINTIIKTTNTQNPVDTYLLKSTAEIHREIEEYFLENSDGYFYDRRKNYYKNLKKDKKKIFDIKYTFKTYSSIFLGIPSQVRTSTKSIFKSKHDIVFALNINKNAYIYSNILDRKIQNILKKTNTDSEFKIRNGVSIITYSLHLSYIYTALLKKCLNFTDKNISSTDIIVLEELTTETELLVNSINLLNIAVEEYPDENKVYLARTAKFENKIKELLDKNFKEKNK